MTLRFDCPNCKSNYEVADDLGGKMIMCRVCKKRVKVQSTPAGAAPAAAGKVAGTSLSRRNFLPIVGLVLASGAAVAIGALLAREPWRTPPTRPDFGPGKGRRKGPPPEEDKKGGKGGTA